jgi:UDPglucose 6-dehydrogenase
MTVIAHFCKDVKVIVVDKNKEKIDQWNSENDLPIFEPGLKELVDENRGKNLFFSNDIDTAIDESEMIFICVDTPIKMSGLGAGSASDTCNVEDVARRIAQVAKSNKIVIEKSTVPVRTFEIIQAILKANSQCKNGTQIHFELISNPEFLSEGSAIKDLTHPNRILLGGGGAGGGGGGSESSSSTNEGLQGIEKLFWLYSHWVPKEKIITTNIWSSELSKLVANAFLAQRLSSINSISAICEATGANINEVARAVGADDRIGCHFLQASIGFGGSSFHQDILNLVYLAQSVNLPEVATYWQSVVDINTFQKNRFVQTILSKMFHTISTKKICIYGFAYKKNTKDSRGTIASEMIKALLLEKAFVMVYDPYVNEKSIKKELLRQGISEKALETYVTYTSDPYLAAMKAHAVVALTAAEQICGLDYEKIYANMAKPAFFFDGKNIFPHDKIHALGAELYVIGQTFASSHAIKRF